MENNGGGAAPTGCYKCGRPGHWSRDCLSEPNTNDDNPPASNSSKTTPSYKPKPPINNASIKKPKLKSPRKTRPKLTPELLLSNGGLGHILRYFPGALKCRGRGHEVDDLRHLLGMYAEWNSRLLPYYNFEQFIHKVEQVGSTKRVKVCLRELQDKIASGADPTKLHELQVQQNTSHEQDAPGDLEMPDHVQETQNKGVNTYEENLLQTTLEEATESGSQPLHTRNVYDDPAGDKDVSNERPNNAPEGSNKSQMNVEQIAQKVEANRKKAYQIAAAKSRIIQPLKNPAIESISEEENLDAPGDMEMPDHVQETLNEGTITCEQDMLPNMEEATEDNSQPLHTRNVAEDLAGNKDASEGSYEIQMTEEQVAQKIEANRNKAMQIAALKKRIQVK